MPVKDKILSIVRLGGQTKRFKMVFKRPAGLKGFIEKGSRGRSWDMRSGQVDNPAQALVWLIMILGLVL